MKLIEKYTNRNRQVDWEMYAKSLEAKVRLMNQIKEGADYLLDKNTEYAQEIERLKEELAIEKSDKNVIKNKLAAQLKVNTKLREDVEAGDEDAYTLEQEIERLKEYTQHNIGCKWWSYAGGPCTCGLNELMSD